MATKELDDQMKTQLANRKAEWIAIAKRAHVSYDWVRKFAHGDIPNPGYRTLRKIQEAMK